MGTDTLFGRPRSTRIWGQTRCPVCRSRTFNVQRSTLNFQWSDRKGAWWAGYGDRHAIWAAGLLALGDLTKRAGRAVQAGGAPRYTDIGTDTQFGRPNFLAGGPDQARPSGGRGCRSTRMWGQTRCPICRSGKFNVRRSTPNFQWSERKGAWWVGYGDRHGVTATPITGFCMSVLWRQYVQCLYFSGA